MRLLTLSLLAMLTLSGCSWMPFMDDDKDDDASETEGYTEEDFYNVIQRNLNANRWEDAIENLQSLEAQFPFGTYADQAQLELIYAHHRSADYEEAIAAADRFIRLHPRHPNVDYAYYIKGLSYLSQSRSFLDHFVPTDYTSRDPGAARDAFATFSELLTLYPNSNYSADARKRMIFLRNLMARYEVHAANYYFERGAYVAAANRGRYVVENFQQTPSVPDGLAIMAEAYHLIGKDDLSKDAIEVLAANFPDYPALDDEGQFEYQGISLEDGSSAMRVLTLGLYDSRTPPHYDTRYKYDPSATPKRKNKDDDEDEEDDSESSESDGEGSLINTMTFGLIGRDGDEDEEEADEEEDEDFSDDKQEMTKSAPVEDEEETEEEDEGGRSFLDVITFGALGDDGEEEEPEYEVEDFTRDNAEMSKPAPVEEEEDSSEDEEEGGRSFLNVITFGALGDDGEEGEKDEEEDEE